VRLTTVQCPHPTRRTDGAAPRLRIAVMSAIGHGATTLSAFDDALCSCGLGNYNHLLLSSVIPPRSTVVLAARHDAPDAEFGHRLFAVEADVRSAERGASIAAGLGWLQWGDGRGVFVEGHRQAPGSSCAALEAVLADELRASLRDLAVRRGVPFAPDRTQLRIVSTRVDAKPACALVVAAYQADGWRIEPQSGGE
jgi:arginine decarboxylase